MKKRLLSLVLCLVMVFSLFPAFGMNAVATADVSPEGYVSLGSTMTGSDIGTWTAGSVPSGYPAAENSTLYVKIGEQYFPVTAENRGCYYTQKFYANGTASGQQTYIKFKQTNEFDSFPMPSNPDSTSKQTGLHTGYYVFDSYGVPRELMYDYEYHSNDWLGAHPYNEYMPYYTDSRGTLIQLWGTDSSANEAALSPYYINTNTSHDYYNNHLSHRNGKWAGWFCRKEPGYNGLRLDLYQRLEATSAYNHVYYTRNGQTVDLANDYLNADVQPNVELFYKSNYTASSITATDADVSEVVEVEMGAPKTITLQFDGCVYDSVSINNENAATVSVENNVLTINPATVGETAKITVTGTANADHFAPAPLVIDITVIPNGYQAPELVDVPNGNYADNSADNKGLFLSKELLFDETTGTYTIEMKTYATGTTVQESSGKPTDIILVLDQSGSMEYKMNSNESDVTLTAEQLYATADEHGRTAYDREVGSWNTQICPVYCFLKDNGRYNVYSLKADGSKETYHNGNATPTNTIQYLRKTRIGALKRSLWSFAQAVAEKDAGHKIAVVGFDSNSENNTEIFNAGTSTQYDTVMANTTTAFDTYAFKNPATAQGLEDLYATSVALNAKGGTYADYGMDLALRILKDRHDSGRDEGRDAVVLFFTDGEPGGVSYNDGVPTADETIQKAHIIKDTYGAKIYTIGVFSGGDGGELDGEDEAGTDYTYTVKEYMEAVSSKYPEVAVFGDVKDPNAKVDTSADYYQLLKSGDTLAELFNNVSQAIGGAAIPLDASSELRDGIDLKNFTTPKESDIEVSTQKGVYVANAAPDFTDGQGNPRPEENHDGATDHYYREVVDGVVMVKDFNYAYNFIGANKQPSGNDLAANEGRQLIVRIKNLLPKRAEDPTAANPLDGQTGNVLPSNLLEPSDAVAGVYETHAAARPVAKVDVPWTKILSRPAVIDFNAKMTVATGVNMMTEEGVEKAAIDGSNGDFIKTGTNVTYQLDSQTQNSASKKATINGVYSDVDKAMAFHAKTNDAAGYWEEIVAIPANCIYFDDSFVTSNTTLNLETDPETGINGIGFNSQLTGATSVTDPNTSVAAGEYEFTFTGTGVDIYCTTSEDGKYVQAALFYADDDEHPIGKSKAMRNYSEETRYNVPTLHFAAPNGEWNTYKVKIFVSNSSKFRLDGIRVYNPVKVDAATQQKIYTDNGAGSEKNASFFNLREMLLNDNHIYSYTAQQTEQMQDVWLENLETLMPNISKVLYVDNADGVRTITQDENGFTSLYKTSFEAYKMNSPKNEIYLAKNQGIAFTVTNYTTLVGDGAKFYIGLSTGSQQDQEVWFTNAATADNAHKANVESAVDMYYEIVPVSGGTFMIKNMSDAIIAVTDLKVCGSSNKLVLGDVSTGAQVLSAEEAEELENTDLTELKVEVNAETMKVLANYVEPGQTPDPDPTVEPTQQPTIQEIIHQLVSAFVSRLFSSISRLFGN